jgi:hypothetical protein
MFKSPPIGHFARFLRRTEKSIVYGNRIAVKQAFRRIFQRTQLFTGFSSDAVQSLVVFHRDLE